MRLAHLTQNIRDSITHEFNFYSYGKISPLTATLPVKELQSGISFHIQSVFSDTYSNSQEIDFWLTLLFKGTDTSMYEEVGNIFASRVASELQRTSQTEIRPSHPVTLTSAQVQAFNNMPHPDFKKNYGHFWNHETIPLTLLIVSRFPKEIGNA